MERPIEAIRDALLESGWFVVSPDGSLDDADLALALEDEAAITLPRANTHAVRLFLSAGPHTHRGLLLEIGEDQVSCANVPGCRNARVAHTAALARLFDRPTRRATVRRALIDALQPLTDPGVADRPDHSEPADEPQLRYGFLDGNN